MEQINPVPSVTIIHETHGKAFKKLMGWAAGGVLLVGAAFAAWELADNYLDIPDLKWPFGIEAQVTPPQVDASVRHDTYKTEKVFDRTCKEDMSVLTELAGSQSFQVDLKLFVLTPGIAKMDKLIAVDFDLCGDNGLVRTNAVLEKDSVTEKVISVSASTDGLVPTRPRVNHVDSSRNCAELRVGDSKKTIDDKIAKWEQELRDWEQKKKGAKRPSCDDGFDVTRAGAPDSVAALKDTAYAAAQIAVTMDAEPLKEMEAQNTKYLAEINDMLRAEFPGANVQVRLNGLADQRQRRMQEARTELERNYYNVQMPSTGSNVVKVTAPDGGEISVKLNSLSVQPVITTGTSVSQERIIPTTSTPIAPATTTIVRKAA